MTAGGVDGRRSSTPGVVVLLTDSISSGMNFKFIVIMALISHYQIRLLIR